MLTSKDVYWAIATSHDACKSKGCVHAEPIKDALKVKINEGDDVMEQLIYMMTCNMIMHNNDFEYAALAVFITAFHIGYRAKEVEIERESKCSPVN